MHEGQLGQYLPACKNLNHLKYLGHSGLPSNLI